MRIRPTRRTTGDTATIAADGFLPEHFWGKDWSHGNSAYGEAVVGAWLRAS